MKDRIIKVISSDELYEREASFEFNSKKIKDSEALHLLLSGYNPGDNYTVEFQTKHVWNCPIVRPAPGLEDVRCNCNTNFNQ